MTFDRFSSLPGFVRSELGRPDLPDLVAFLRGAATVDDLAARLGRVARELGFSFHALVEHGDIGQAPPRFFFLQNYPQTWVEAYVQAGLHRFDPTHRLASLSPESFVWRDLGRSLPLLDREQRLLEDAGRAGLGEGFTVPLQATGYRPASCSFATEVGQAFPIGGLLAAEFVAHIAFKKLFGLMHPDRGLLAPRLTPQQLECLRLAAQGKSDWEIARILGLAPSSVTTYLKAARQRLGVISRTQLALAAVYYGWVGFDEVKTWL